MTERSIENQQEFANAVQYSLKIRNAMAKFSNRYNSSKLNAKLIKHIMQIIKADTKNVRGQRTVLMENLSMMQNLVLTESSAPQLFIHQNFSAQIEGTNECKAIFKFVGDFIPAIQIQKIKSATHLELSLAMIQTNFDDSSETKIVEAVKYFQLTDPTNQSQSFETPALPAIPGFAFISILFLSYYQEVNGIKYLLETKSNNSSMITHVKVD